MRLLKKLKLPSTSTNISKNKSAPEPSDLYSIAINSLNGEPILFSDFKGKYILLVNVASKCGFTPQYRELQQLSDLYPEKLVVVGVPCNQFGGQEPGGADQIQSFCDLNFGVTFLMTEKIMVKGEKQHPLYAWLTQKALNGVKNSTVKWNFQKYLVNDKGQLVDFYFSITKPLSSKITRHLK